MSGDWEGLFRSVADLKGWFDDQIGPRFSARELELFIGIGRTWVSIGDIGNDTYYEREFELTYVPDFQPGDYVRYSPDNHRIWARANCRSTPVLQLESMLCASVRNMSDRLPGVYKVTKFDPCNDPVMGSSYIFIMGEKGEACYAAQYFELVKGQSHISVADEEEI